MAKNSTLTLRISEEEKEKLREIAEKRGLSLASYLIEAGFNYNPSATTTKKTHVGFFNIKGALNVSITLEVVDGKIAAVGRFCKNRRPLSGLMVVLATKFEQISYLSNMYYVVPQMVKLIDTLSEKDQTLLRSIMEMKPENMFEEE